jgi:cell division protein FtsZ
LGCELAAGASLLGAKRRLVDFSGEELRNWEPSETVCLNGDGDDTAYMDPDLMREAAKEAGRRLAKESGEDALVFLLGSLGGQTGAVVLPALANELRVGESAVVAVAVEPLPFEGAGRADLAARALAELELTADLILTVPNRPLNELCDTSLPVAQALAYLKGKTVRAVQQLTTALADGTSVGLQPAELRRSLRDVGRGVFGVGIGRGDDRVEAAIRDACANSFLTQEACQNGTGAILHLLGGPDLSLSEVSSATEMAAHIVGNVPIQAGLSTKGSLGEVRATLLVTGIYSFLLENIDDGNGRETVRHPDLTHYDGQNLEVPAFLRRQSFARIPR